VYFPLRVFTGYPSFCAESMQRSVDLSTRLQGDVNPANAA
jgi:hypothetical protein